MLKGWQIMWIIGALLGMFLYGCSQSAQQEGDRLKVIASFYPMYDFAKNIGGDRIDVLLLIPEGVEPHEYEPTASDIRELNKANVFVLNGILEAGWAEKLLQGIYNEQLIVVDTGKGITLLGNDPHFWLNPNLAKIQVAAIRDGFSQADPANKQYYEGNAAIYMQKLDELDTQLHAGLAACDKKDLLITHATLAYFCKEYGCNQVPIEGANSEGEPSPAVLAAIIRQAKDKNITVVFVEALVSPRAAETIAADIHGTVAVFNSVHGLTSEEERRGDNYLSLMEKNAEVIITSLGCR